MKMKRYHEEKKEGKERKKKKESGVKIKEYSERR